MKGTGGVQRGRRKGIEEVQERYREGTKGIQKGTEGVQ